MTRTGKIIVGGFLVRAFVGQALFWISYLKLPVARTLQLGDGFWFFAADGAEYLRLATDAAARGIGGIFFLHSPVPSHLFVRLVAMLVAMLGSVASLALLINCAAYALTCFVLVRMGQKDAFLAAIAFSPAAMLFSTQLLKDTLFVLLIVVMAAIFRRWQELWRGGATRGELLACAAAMLLVLYALAGIRWYFAAIVWGASAVFFVLVSWTAPRRGVALAASAIVFVLLSQSVRLGGRDMAPELARVLNPLTVLQSEPDRVPGLVGRVRRNFDRTPAATTIEAGRSLAPDEVASARALPATPAERLISGFAAAFVPRFVAQPLGLIHVAGGRGFWLFAEVDTIVFSLVVVWVAVSCARSMRKGTASPTPLFVLLTLVFVLLGGLMLYTVNNFGTLFRLRQMLYVVATVIPVTVARVSDRNNGASTKKPAGRR